MAWTFVDAWMTIAMLMRMVKIFFVLLACCGDACDVVDVFVEKIWEDVGKPQEIWERFKNMRRLKKVEEDFWEAGRVFGEVNDD